MNTKNNYGLLYLCFIGIFFICGFTINIFEPFLIKYSNISNFNVKILYSLFWIFSLIISTGCFFIDSYRNKLLDSIKNNTAIIGLIIFYIGISIIYIYTIKSNIYTFMLILAIIFISCGSTLIKILINFYVIEFTSGKKSSSILNLVLAFYTAGYFVEMYLISKFEKDTTNIIELVNVSYIIISLLIIISSLILIKKSKILYSIKPYLASKNNKFTIFYNTNFILGLMAIFFYGGVEVSIGNNIIKLLKSPNILSTSEEVAKKYLYFYWAGIMIGRLCGFLYLTNIIAYLKYFLLILIYTSLIFILIYITGFEFKDYIYFIAIALINFICFALSKKSESRMLTIFSLCCIILLIICMSNNFNISAWAILGTGIFNSIIFANIFCMATYNLGKNLFKGIAMMLVMSFIGSFVINSIQEFFTSEIGIQKSFVIPILSYVYIVLYGIYNINEE